MGKGVWMKGLMAALTSDQVRQVKRKVSEWRERASFAGPQHSLWDLIFDAEALLDGKQTILPAEDILAAVSGDG